MKSVLAKLKSLWAEKGIWPFLGLGISCQAPINLIGGLLALWATETGLNLKAVGLFALVQVPYSIKFLWAPLIDRINLPFSKKIGRKKAWGFMFQLGIIGCLYYLSFLNPATDTFKLFIACLFIAFCATSQEIVVDALRIDTLSGERMNKGSAFFQLGARIGFLMVMAGMMSLSKYLSWHVIYLTSTFIVALGVVSLCFIKESKNDTLPVTFHQMVISPFKDFISRESLGLLCIFIVAYKLCNGMLGKMAYPFYYKIGFTKFQIGLVSGTFGVFMTMLGIFLGTILLNKYKFKPLLIILGATEIFTSLAFSVLAWVGPNMPLFFLVITFDNIIGGMGGAVWMVFLSSLCSRHYSATQYSFLNALTMVPLTVIASSSGFLAEFMGWPLFFAFTGALMIPALYMLKYCHKLFQKKKSV